MILLIEDREEIREVFRLALEHRGFAVREATDGSSGVEAARVHHPELILLDVGLPDIDGWEVASELQSDPATADIPILMVTANITPDAEVRAKSMGCREFVAKPVDPLELVRIVEGCLDPGPGPEGRPRDAPPPPEESGGSQPGVSAQ